MTTATEANAAFRCGLALPGEEYYLSLLSCIPESICFVVALFFRGGFLNLYV